MRQAVYLLLLAQALSAEYAIHTRGSGISYYGSGRVYVGYYNWGTREPLSLYNSSDGLVARYDHSNVTCSASTNICTAPGHRLPNGTQVKLGSTGTLPSPLLSWRQNPNQVYYIRDTTTDTFRLSTTLGGAAVDLTSSGSGTHGMSFAGYSHAITLSARFVRRMVCDTRTDICSTDSPHGYTDGTSMYLINEGGALPAPLGTFFDSRPAKHCAVVVDSNRFQLRFSPSDSPCPSIPFGRNTAVITCSSSTSTCSYPSGFDVSTGTKLRFKSTGSLPAPLVAGTTYYATSVSDDARTFKLDPSFNQSSSISLSSAGSGVITAEAVIEDITSTGSGTHYASYSSGSSIYIHDIQGYPNGTTFSYRGNNTVTMNESVSHRGFGSSSGSIGTVTLFAKVPATAAARQYPVTVTFSESSREAVNPKTTSYIVEAMKLTPLVKADPSSYPSIPNLAKWESLMTSSTDGGGGAKGPVYPRCPDRRNPASGTGSLSFPSISSKVWYYDGAANFFEIAGYAAMTASVPDRASWANCGEYVAAALRDGYIQQPGRPGYTYFPRGLYLAYKRTGDIRYKDALMAIADGGNHFRGVNSEYAMREHAYAFERRLYRYLLTNEVDHSLHNFADVALGMLLTNSYGDEARTFMEPFMAGLLARPLIHYYQLFQDERVPVVMKLFATKFWASWYNASTNQMLYNTEPYGSRCTVSCQTPVATNLNNLVAPIFAFLWRLTANDTYRLRGDQLFGSNFDDGTPYDPKQWNQAYYWSWDFVAWRLGRKKAY